MIIGIELLTECFETTDDNNVICELTDNTIILCDSSHTKDIVSDEIEKLNNEDGANYGSSSGEDVDIETVIRYRPTSIYDINNGEQRIVVTVEDPYILTAKNKEDIWFAAINKDEKIEIYPFTAFMGHHEIWESGIDRVYRDTLIGRFGEFGKYPR